MFQATKPTIIVSAGALYETAKFYIVMFPCDAFANSSNTFMSTHRVLPSLSREVVATVLKCQCKIAAVCINGGAWAGAIAPSLFVYRLFRVQQPSNPINMHSPSVYALLSFLVL